MAIFSLLGRFPFAALTIDTLATLELTICAAFATTWARDVCFYNAHRGCSAGRQSEIKDPMYGQTERQDEGFKDERLQALLKAASFPSMPKQQQQDYKEYMTTEQDVREYWEEQVSDAREEGFAEGEAKGVSGNFASAEIGSFSFGRNRQY